MSNRLRTLVTVVWHTLLGFVFASSADPIIGWGLLLYFPAILASVFIHEVGHAVGAWLVGWRVVVFSVWRFAFHRQILQLAILDRDMLQEQAGWVLAVPSGPRQNTWARRAVMVAGGPVANLLQAAAALVYAVSVPSTETILGASIDPLMLGFALLGIGYFFGNIVPRADGDSSNDGSMLVEAFRGISRGKAPRALIWANGLLQSNVRLKDVPQWMLSECATGATDDLDDPKWLASLEIGRTLDHSPVDVDLARSQIDRYRSEYGPNDWLRTCDAFLAAVNERDLERASGLIEQIGKPCDIPQMEAAARAAILKLSGDDSAAGEWLDRMDEIVAAKSPFHNLTFKEIRARVERMEPMTEETLVSLRPSRVGA